MEKEKKEKKENKNKEKDLSIPFFLSTLSHEIRTPLNGVVGYTQLLFRTQLSTNQKMYLLSLNKCSLQLISLLNDVIDYSKLAVNKMKVKKECFALKDIVDIVDTTMRQRIKEKRQRYHLSMSRNIPKFIISDKQKIIQILVNLLSNANKFTSIGGFISLQISPKEPGILEFTVKDEGVGISKEEQGKLFDVFFQLQQSIGKPGSGLGLAISQKLVHLLGGEIKVSSKPKKGSTFSFTIKYKQEKEVKKFITHRIKNLKGKYVLVVDDNIDNRIILGEMLFDWKMKPVVCASGFEAERLFKRKRYKFSLILLDICMPGMSGLELAEKIKLEDPHVPIIGLSSIDETNDSNFERILKKPVNKTQLLMEIQNIFRGSLRSHIDIDSSNEEEENEEEKEGEEEENIDENKEEEEEKEKERMDEKKSKKMKILVVDDIDTNREVLGEMLTTLGYKDTYKAENYKQSIEALEKHKINIVFLDLRMPGKNGFDVIKYINKKQLKCTVVVLTASVIDDDKEKCKEFGIKYFISKPYSIEQIKKSLKMGYKNMGK